VGYNLQNTSQLLGAAYVGGLLNNDFSFSGSWYAFIPTVDAPLLISQNTLGQSAKYDWCIGSFDPVGQCKFGSYTNSFKNDAAPSGLPVDI